MKRLLALLTTLLLVLSLFPVSALAADEPTEGTEPTAAAETATPEPTAEPTAKAEPTVEPTLEPTPVADNTPEPEATEVLASASPAPEVIFLHLLGCDRLDTDGNGYIKVTCQTGDELTLKVEGETNADLSYSWQTLDATRPADDPYVDIDVNEVPTADDKALSITASETAIGVEDYYRCVVTAKLGDQTIEAVCYFTLESSLPPLDLSVQEDPGIVTDETAAYVSSQEELETVLEWGDPVIYTDADFEITGDIEIPADRIFVATNTTLTIAHDAVVTNHGYFASYGTIGAINVSGTIVNTKEVSCGYGSTLNILSDGEYVASGDDAFITLVNDGADTHATINGIPKSLIDYEGNVYTSADWDDLFSQYGTGYHHYRFTVKNSISCDGTSEIPSDMDIYVIGTLTVPYGATLTINGIVDLQGGTLVNNGTIVNNGTMTGYGLYSNNGAYTGDGGNGITSCVENEAQLLDALAHYNPNILINQDIVLHSNITVPSGVQLSVYHATLTVPTDITLECNGNVLSNGAGSQLIVEGEIENNGNVICWDGGEITFRNGGVYSQSSSIDELALSDSGSGTRSVINGIDDLSKIWYYCTIHTTEDFSAALARANAGYRFNTFNFENDFTFDTNVEIPGNYGIDANANLTVPTGVTLTVYGTLHTASGTIFVNHGTIINEGTLNFEGEFINDGLVSGSGESHFNSNVSTEAELRTAIDNKAESINVVGSFALQDDLLIPSDVNIDLNDAIIEVPSGITVTSNAWINVNQGGFFVRSGGSFINNNGISLNDDAFFEVESGGNYDGVNGNIYQHILKRARISGIDLGDIMISYDVASEDDIQLATSSFGTGYKGVEIIQNQDITLTNDLTLAEECHYYMEGEQGCILEVSAGITLTNNGFIKVNDQSELIIDAGAEFANNGTIVINGTYTNNGAYSGEGSLNFGETSVYSWDELKAAVEKGITSIYIDADITLEESITLQSNTTWGLDNDPVSSLTVPSGVTLTVDGELYMDAGSIDIMSGATLVNNGFINVQGGQFTTHEGSTFNDYANVDLVGTAVGTFNGTYTPGQDHWFSYTDTQGGATISGIDLKDVFFWANVSSIEDIYTNMAKVSSGYRYFNLYLQNDLTLPADFELVANVLLEVSEGNTLTIAAGNTAFISGCLQIVSGAILEIQTGATLQINDNGYLNLEGTVIGDGSITGNYEYSAVIHSYEELLVAETTNATHYQIIGSFTLGDDFTLPSGKSMTIEDVTLTIPSGVKLTNNGSIYLGGGTLLVQSGATLDNRSEIWVYKSTSNGALTIANGGTFIRGEDSWIGFAYGEANFTGIPNDKLDISVLVSTEAALKSALAMNLSVYHNATITITAPITLTANASISAGVRLEIVLDDRYAGLDGLTIASGATLTNAGELLVQEGNTLVVNGTLANIGAGSLNISGDLVNNGSVTYAGTASAHRYVSTEEALIDAVEKKIGTITYLGDITLTSELVMPDGSLLESGSGATLTIAEGGKLSLGISRIWLDQGSLVVESGGTLDLANHAFISLWGSGQLTVNGDLILHGNSTKIYLREDKTASISGISEENCKYVQAYKNVYNQSEMIDALNYYEDSPYADTLVYPCAAITLTQDVTVPNSVDLDICDGVVFTIPAGRTLTIAEGGCLRVESTGSLVVNGTLENYGKVELANAKVTINGSFLNHSSDTSYTMAVTSLAQLKTALASTLRPLKITCDGFTINSNITIPSGITVMFDKDTIESITAGTTVTVNGAFGTYGALANIGTIINNGKFSVEWKGSFNNFGTLTNNGTATVYGAFTNNASVNIATDKQVRFYFGATRGGASGTWYATEGTQATALTVTGPDTIGIGENLTNLYGVTASPSDVWSKDVIWSISDGIDYATIDETTGALVGIAEGTVLIRATAQDGSEVYAEKTVSIVDYSMTISGQDWLLAGKTLQMTGAFVPSNLTGTTVVWSLADGDAAYASINTTGVLTAKLVTEQHMVTVIASPADGKAGAAQKEITIYPLVSTLKILQDETDRTGQTLTLNSNASDTLSLYASLYPSDVKGGITWSLSATDAVTMEVGEDGTSVTLTPVSGASKLVTLTAKANDGSSISAIVKIQVSALSNGVTIGGVTDEKMLAGAKAQLTASFTDPQPANRAVKWWLEPEYEAYATLTTTGLLTAKVVTDEVTITLYAIPADGGPKSDAYTVTIQPLATAVVIKNGESYVTGTTVTLDMLRSTSLALTAQTWPNAAADAVTWTSSAPQIASVDADGVVTAKLSGAATITATATDGSGKSALVKLTITSLPQSIEAVESETNTNLRGGTGATYTVKDSSSGNLLPASMIRWSLADGNAAYASITTAGVLKTTLVPCQQTIHLRAEVIGNEAVANDEVTVTIYPAVQSMGLTRDGISVAGTTQTINAAQGEVPENISLSALLLPLDSMQNVVWTSSNTKVLQVADGIVSPVQVDGVYTKGSAVITAKALDGSNKSASVTIQVVEGVKGISFNVEEGKTIECGKSIQLNAAADNATATNKKINLSVSEGADYVTLSASGLLTTKTVYDNQTVIIKAVSVDGYATNYLTLNVTAKENTLRIVNWDGTKDYSGTLEMIDANTTDMSRELLAQEDSPTGSAITWSVVPSYVAKVTGTSPNMQLQALTTGVAVVTAKAADGRTASFTVEIYRGATDLTITAPKGMDAENLTLASGKSMLLSGAFTPSTGITTKGIVWSLKEDGASRTSPVLQNDYATISTSGLVTAKANLTEPMDIWVRAFSMNAPYLTSDDIRITIQPIVTGLDIIDSDSAVLSGSTVVLDLNDGAKQLGVAAYPSNASQSVTWSSSNKTVATISDTGIVTALKAGTVTITAKTNDGSAKSATMKLTVAVGVTDVTITSTKGFEVRGGATLQLGVAFTPTVPTDKRIAWSLAPEDAQFASISTSGLITTKALTSAVTIRVTVTSLDNTYATDTKDITICPPATKVLIRDAAENDISGSTITLDLNSADLTIALSSVNLPQSSGGAMQGVVWTSSSATILKVTDGLLEPVINAKTGLYNTGTVTITATAADGSGKKTTVKVNVVYLVSEINFASGLTVQAGKTLTLKPTFAPLNATNKTVKWSIKTSDTPYATISTTGVLTAKKLTAARDIVVICAAQDGSGITQEVTVTINP